MCDFCENREEINTGTGNWYILKVGELYGMYYRHGQCRNSCGVEIFHCPLCGRKLSEETEKPNTDEIIAKLKENLTEDEQKKLDESIKSFADGVNGLWKVVRKGICND